MEKNQGNMERMEGNERNNRNMQKYLVLIKVEHHKNAGILQL